LKEKKKKDIINEDDEIEGKYFIGIDWGEKELKIKDLREREKQWNLVVISSQSSKYQQSR
jgi:hypothetical protein